MADLADAAGRASAEALATRLSDAAGTFEHVAVKVRDGGSVFLTVVQGAAAGCTSGPFAHPAAGYRRAAAVLERRCKPAALRIAAAAVASHPCIQPTRPGGSAQPLGRCGARFARGEGAAPATTRGYREVLDDADAALRRFATTSHEGARGPRGLPAAAGVQSPRRGCDSSCTFEITAAWCHRNADACGGEGRRNAVGGVACVTLPGLRIAAEQHATMEDARRAH